MTTLNFNFRPWKYVLLPHLIMGSKGEEQEDALRSNIRHKRSDVSRRQLVLEYIAGALFYLLHYIVSQ
jgi:hypothetical protein